MTHLVGIADLGRRAYAYNQAGMNITAAAAHVLNEALKGELTASQLYRIVTVTMQCAGFWRFEVPLADGSAYVLLREMPRLYGGQSRMMVRRCALLMIRVELIRAGLYAQTPADVTLPSRLPPYTDGPISLRELAFMIPGQPDDFESVLAEAIDTGETNHACILRELRGTAHSTLDPNELSRCRLEAPDTIVRLAVGLGRLYVFETGRWYHNPDFMPYSGGTL